MRAADWIVDIGPEAGVGGGEVVYSGPAERIGEANNSLTAEYLTESDRLIYHSAEEPMQVL